MTAIGRSAAPRAVEVVRERARDVSAQLAGRAIDIEARRRLPPDLVDALRAAGCFSVLLTSSHGGAGASLPEALRLYEDLARGDASTGWVVMIGASGWSDLAALPRPTFDTLFSPGADTVIAGAIAPAGSISAVADGYRVTGRWGFVSGCDHATHFFANAVEGVVDGEPAFRVAVLDRAAVIIEDTWHTSGLRGTGSHHITVDAVVPAEWTFVPFVDPPCIDAPIVRVPTPALFALGIAAVAIGAARGALDTVAELAGDRIPLFAGAPQAADPCFQYGLARSDARLGAAATLIDAMAERLWDRAVAGADVPLELRARTRAAATWATEAALAATGFACSAAGGAAVYDTNPLQRRQRDVQAMTQHFLVRADSYTNAGAILAGQPLTTAVF